MSHVDNIKFRKYFIIISEQALFHVRFFNIVTRKKTPKLGNFLSLTLFRMGFFRAAHRWGGEGGLFGPPSLKSATASCNDETWLIYALPKEDPKNV